MHQQYQMTTIEREIAAKWPAWSVRLAPIHPANEIFDPAQKRIVINPEGDREWALAHVWAHFELGHHLGSGAFTAKEEEEADDLAVARLGITDWSPWSALLAG